MSKSSDKLQALRSEKQQLLEMKNSSQLAFSTSTPFVLITLTTHVARENPERAEVKKGASLQNSAGYLI
jgi:hypothetical protein